MLAAKATHHHLQVVLRLRRSRQGAPTDRASLRLLHCARRRPTQRACSFLPLAHWWRERLLAAKPTHLHHPANGLLLQRSSDRSSKRAAAPRCEKEADSRCVLVFACLWALVWRECLPPATKAPAGVFGSLQTEAAMNLRLIEQACGCSTVREGGGLKVRARVCLPLGTQVERVLAACDQGTCNCGLSLCKRMPP